MTFDRAHPTDGASTVMILTGSAATPAVYGYSRAVACLTMARTRVDEATQLSAADVIHKRFGALPSESTVGQVRDWFAASSHRRIAVLANHRRYAGSLAARTSATSRIPFARPQTSLVLVPLSPQRHTRSRHTSSRSRRPRCAFQSSITMALSSESLASPTISPGSAAPSSGGLRKRSLRHRWHD